MRPSIGLRVLCVPLLCLCLAAGCSQSGTAMPAPPDNAGTDPAALLRDVLPPPSELRATQDVFSDVFHEAGDYVELWPNDHVVPTLERQLCFRPYFTSAEDIYQTAYAIYSFDVTGYEHESTLRLWWSGKSGSGQVWVGMADFEHNAWRWYRPDNSDAVMFDEAACLEAGQAHAVVLVTDTEQWTLDYVYMGSRWAPVVEGVSPRHGTEDETITVSPFLKAVAQTGKGASELLSWQWDFGTGATPNTPTGSAPEITLGSAGVYGCTVIASGLAGDCEHEFLLTVNALGTVWDIEAVAQTGAAGGQTSLALESSVDENPHIGFQSLDDNNLYYTYFTGSAWITDLIGHVLPENGFSETGLALDAFENPHLAYVSGQNAQVSRRFSSLWYVDPVDGAYLPGTHWFEAPSLAIDSAGNRHVAWHETLWDGDYAADTVLYSWEDGEDWTEPVAVAASGGEMDIDTILASHPLRLASDAPHVCYFDGQAPGTVSYASYSGGWNGEEVQTGVDPVIISMVIDPATGYPHVAYVDKPTELFPGELVYTCYDGSQWNETILSGTGDVGKYCSIGLDLAGGPRICYYAALSHDLAYAYHDGLSWQLSVIDQHGDVGQYCAMATGQDGRTHVSYFDATQGFVKYARMPEM